MPDRRVASLDGVAFPPAPEISSEPRTTAFRSPFRRPLSNARSGWHRSSTGLEYPPMSPQRPATEWYRQHFNEDYEVLYPRRDLASARREVDFVVRALGLTAGMRVLDLCCGTGRHLEALRIHGIHAVGVDLSPTLLAETRGRLTASQRGDDESSRTPAILLVEADMRRLPFPDGNSPETARAEMRALDLVAPDRHTVQDVDAVDAVDDGLAPRTGALQGGAPGERDPGSATRDASRSGDLRGFDAVLSFFTSFGYFDEPADHEIAAREIARVLGPDGRFFFDLFHPDRTVNELVPRSERTLGTIRIVEERSYDPLRRRVEKTIELQDLATGTSRRYFESVRIFALDEFEELLGSTGLAIDETYGDFDGRPFGPSSPRLLITGRLTAGRTRGGRDDSRRRHSRRDSGNEDAATRRLASLSPGESPAP
jgi:SAM-dependent methyltransferase